MLCDGRAANDPIAVVREYPDPADGEIVGLLAALLAYGRVDLLQAHIRLLLAEIGPGPAARLREGVPRLPAMTYRFHRARDLEALLRGIRTLLLRHGSLGAAFAGHWRRTGELRASLEGFAGELRSAAGRAGPGLRFLLPDPGRGGACKRWLLYLRWMVRSEPGDPDLGLWRELLPASALVIPLDTHVVRVSRRLGLTARRTPDWKMAEEVTAALRRIAPEDPVRYDFPLCHLGMRGSCPPRLTSTACRRCPLEPHCPTGAAWGERAKRRKGGRLDRIRGA
jgi:uncharacterized protein (TIGR02757 family)